MKENNYRWLKCDTEIASDDFRSFDKLIRCPGKRIVGKVALWTLDIEKWTTPCIEKWCDYVTNDIFEVLCLLSPKNKIKNREKFI